MMELFSGFILGLLGSFHCAAMCGPITLSLPDASHSKWPYLKRRLLYNSGRILSYSFLGLLFGFIGNRIYMFGLQSSFTFGIGIFVLLSAILSMCGERHILKLSFTNKIYIKYRTIFSKILGNKNKYFYLIFGIMNGFLPCGLVYIALSGAMLSSGIFPGTVYMMLFGIGTLPVMISVSYLRNGFRLKIRNRINRLIPVFRIILGLLFILRGLNLGIPYLSPSDPLQLKKTNEEQIICN